MKNTKKGVLQLFVTLIVMAALGAILYLGYTTEYVKGVQDIGLGLDLDGGLSITYETDDPNPDQDKLETTIYRMQKRVENYSTEASAYQQGDNRICVDIPGITNAEQILSELGNSGNVYFIMGNGTSGVDNIAAGVDADGNTTYTLTRSMDEIIAAGDLVLDGSGIQTAEAAYRNGDGVNQTKGTTYYVELTLKDEGQASFYAATTTASKYYYTSSSSSDYYKGVIAIVYDNEVISAPRCENPIDSTTATITGNFTFDEVKNLANTIKIGALPLELHQLQYSIVGAQLGSNALQSILIAGAIGLALVMVFMILFYRLPGFIASLALIIYTALDILAILLFDVTLTLPGIAGIILSVGMAVDANIIIFTRIREELRSGKTVNSSIKIGFGKATSAIVDGNITTLIAAVVLYLRGSGTVRGFAITLGIGIVLSMFMALLGCRFMINAAYNLGFDKPKFYGVAKETKVIGFTKKFAIFGVFSLILIGAGIVGLIVNQAKNGKILNYGLDFVGGTSIEVYFDEGTTPPSNSEIEEFASQYLDSTPQVVQVQGENAIIIKTDTMIVEDGSSDEVATVTGDGNLDSGSGNTQIANLKKGFLDTYGVSSDNIMVQSISASVSSEMKQDAIWAVVIAGICMLIYIWIRFSNIAFAVSAVLALLHDVLVVLAVYAVFNITVDNSFIAVMLTIVGYSINATIVIFDRIRENLGGMGKKETLNDVVDKSISETLSRSINTSLTTLISIIMVAVLGADTIRVFAIPLIVGLVCGAYSSVCITGSLWLSLRKLGKKKA